MCCLNIRCIPFVLKLSKKNETIRIDFFISLHLCGEILQKLFYKTKPHISDFLEHQINISTTTRLVKVQCFNCKLHSYAYQLWPQQQQSTLHFADQLDIFKMKENCCIFTFIASHKEAPCTTLIHTFTTLFCMRSFSHYHFPDLPHIG